MFGRRRKELATAQQDDEASGLASEKDGSAKPVKKEARWWRQMIRKWRVEEAKAVSKRAGVTRSEIIDLILVAGLSEIRMFSEVQLAEWVGRTRLQRRLIDKGHQ